jgi:hypothetical protein
MKKAILGISLALLVVTVCVLPAATRPRSEVRVLSQAQFFAMFQSNSLAKVRVYYPAERGQVDGAAVMLNEVRGIFYNGEAGDQVLRDPAMPKALPFVARVQLTPELEKLVTARTNVLFVERNAHFIKVRDWLRRQDRGANP